MEDPTQLTCLLCCSSYYPVKLEEEDDFDDNCSPPNYFLNFLDELRLIDKPSFFELDGRAVCSSCFNGIRQAMRTKRDMDGAECHVRELQTQILKAMKQMGSLVDQYFKELQDLKGIVKGSSKNVIGFRCYQSSEKRKYKRDVLEFRKRIVEVAGSLEMFKTDLNTKNLTGTAVSAVKPASKASTELDLNIDLGRSRRRVNLNSVVGVRPHFEDDDDSLEEMDAQAQDDEDFHISDDDGGYLEDPIEYEDDDETEKLEVSSTSKRSNVKRPSTADAGESEDVSNKKPRLSLGHDKNKVNFLIKDKRKLLSHLSKEYNIQFSKLSKWKKDLLPRLLHMAVNIKIPEKGPDGNMRMSCPTESYSIQYDNATGQLIFSGYPINIQEDQRKVSCGTCDYIVKSSEIKNAPRYVIEHILGNHLNAYCCRDCGASYKSTCKFRVHLKSHSKAITCNICGKPLSTPEYVRTHLWTHMSKEEQEEAVRNGEKDRRTQWKSYSDSVENSFVCSDCGQAFRTRRQLKTHSQVHLEVNERKKFLCPNCGKMMMRKDSLQKHLEKFCFAVKRIEIEDQSNWLPCNGCLERFKTKKGLKKHKKEVHGVRREIVCCCELCGDGNGGFLELPSQSALLIHQRKVHEGKEVWTCFKEGCGKEFLKKSKWMRHVEGRSCVVGGWSRGRKESVKNDCDSDVNVTKVDGMEESM